jgi:ankyrin repeat protein
MYFPLFLLARLVYDAVRPRTLLELVDARNVRQLEARLRRGLDPDSGIPDADEGGAPSPLLLFAVSRQCLPMVDLLLRHGADPNRASPVSGVSPLLLAVRLKNEELVGLLLDNGAAAGLRDATGTPPLIDAAYNNLPDVCGLLLAGGAEVDVRCEAEQLSGATPLMVAVLFRQFEAAERLLQSGADPNVRFGERGHTVLQYALFGCERRIAEALLRHGAEVEAVDLDGMSPLHACLYKKWPELGDQLAATRLLLERGAAVNRPVAAGEDQHATPLLFASVQGDPALLELLLEHGADVRYHVPVENGYGMGALQAAVQHNRPEGLAVLLRHGAPLNPLGTRSCGALTICIEHGFSEMAQRLLAAGADPSSRIHSRDGERDYPLLGVAAAVNRPPMLELLRDTGASLAERGSWGATLLHMAINQQARHSVEWLLAEGADIEAEDSEGLRPLHEAVLAGAPELVELLLGRGADPNARASFGRQPLDLLGYNHGNFPPAVFKRIEKALLGAGAKLSATYT